MLRQIQAVRNENNTPSEISGGLGAVIEPDFTVIAQTTKKVAEKCPKCDKEGKSFTAPSCPGPVDESYTFWICEGCGNKWDRCGAIMN